MAGLYVGNAPIGKLNVGVFSGNGITPSGTKDITTNGIHDVTNYANANVNVPSTGIDTSDATATETDMANGVTAYVNGEKITGTIPVTNGISLLGSYDKELMGHLSFIANNDTKKIVNANNSIRTNVPMSDFGDAEAANVLVGKTFTSANGFNIAGTYEPSTGGSDPILQSKIVNSSTTIQTVEPDTGYDGLSSVTVNAMPTATQATPSVSIDSNGLITASATQSAGYVSAGTKSSTQQLTTQSAKTVTPTTSEQTVVTSGKYTTGDIKVAAMPNGTLNAPTINTSTGVVTAAVGTSGYLASGTSKTLNLTTKGAATITPTESTQTIASGRYLTGTQTIAAIPNTYVGSGVTKKGAATITPTESAQTIGANQYLTGVQTISAIPSDYIGSAVQVVNFDIGTTLPDPSTFGEGDLFLVM